jgi:uncharacterized membrane protein YqgA involved in biofilm formation
MYTISTVIKVEVLIICKIAAGTLVGKMIQYKKRFGEKTGVNFIQSNKVFTPNCV